MVVSIVDQFFFGALPYIMLVLFFGVQAYRWVTNRFAWSARSSEMFAKQVLGVAAVPFHYSIILLLAAHILGALSGAFLTRELLVLFYFLATIAGAILVYSASVILVRRLTIKSVRASSDLEDFIIPVFLVAVPSIGLIQYYVLGGFGIFPTVAVWIQSVFMADPRVDLMATLPLLNRVHIGLVLIFLCYWPFTKLVHMITFPVTYIWRRYQPMRMHRRVIQ